MEAEHYRLHFQPHLSELSASVSKLYKTEKFADVVLYTSKLANGAAPDIPTVGIYAHRFILASCSQYFETIFERTPIPSTGPLVIVLPPNLSYRTIQVLVEYMYNGTTMVTESLLNEVLMGGQFLMIRGLYHAAGPCTVQNQSLAQAPLPPRNENTVTVYSSPAVPAQAQHQASNYSNIRSPPVSSRYVHGEAAMRHLFRPTTTSAMPKSSPAVMRSPKPCMGDIVAMPPKHHNAHGISINKNVAIDPEDKCCYQVAPPPQHDIPIGAPSPPHATSICNVIGCNSCTLPPSSALPVTDALPMPRRRSSHSVELRINRDYMDQQCGERPVCEPEDTEIGFEDRSRRELPVCNRVINDCCPPEHMALPRGHYVAIKQEPTDWSSSSAGNDNSNGNMAQPERPRSPSPTTHHQSITPPINYNSAAVKLEMNPSVCSTEEVDEEPHDYSRVCKICLKRYESTELLHCHMNSHNKQELIEAQRPRAGSGGITQFGNAGMGDTLAPTNIPPPISSQPKKRRRISENSLDHLTLVCDICNIAFDAAAEWVRHMNNQHTEMELAVANSRQNGEHRSSTSTSANAASSAATTTTRQTINHKKYGSRHAYLTHKRSNGGIESILTANDNINTNPDLSTSSATSSNSTATTSDCVSYQSPTEKSSQQKTEEEPSQ